RAPGRGSADLDPEGPALAPDGNLAGAVTKLRRLESSGAERVRKPAVGRRRRDRAGARLAAGPWCWTAGRGNSERWSGRFRSESRGQGAQICRIGAFSRHRTVAEEAPSG